MSTEARPPKDRPKAPDMREIEVLRQQLEMYQLIFESIHYGALVTDERGYVTHFNKPYGLFLDMNPDAQIGRHCTFRDARASLTPTMLSRV